MEMQNQKKSKECFQFRTLNLWNQVQDKEELKYTKALNYLINRVYPCCEPRCTPQCSKSRKKQSFIVRIINIIFWNKF